jgi:hypothetical protein
MKNRRLPLLTLGLVALGALGVTGCVLTSAQVLAHFPLPNPFTITSADDFEVIPVDLGTVSAYKEHKDKLKDVVDFALIGNFKNVSGPGGGVEVYISAAGPVYDSAAAIRAGATKLWGPGEIGKTGSVRTIGWDDSAALFSAAGKAVLLREVKGDGQFTLYAIGTPQGVSNEIKVEKGFLILVISAGV